MTITPEQARERADATLRALYRDVTDWDKALVEQAIDAIGDDGRTFSMNDVRDLLPDLAHGTAGVTIHGLLRRRPPLLVKVGEEPSTAASTHGKRINVYRLARHVYQPAATDQLGEAA